MRCILLKYGELILKGLNRNYFEKLLLNQIRGRLKDLGKFEVVSMQSTVYVTPIGNEDDDSLIEPAFERVSTIFGIVSLCIAYCAEKNLEDIIRVAKQYMPAEINKYKSFKADAKRCDKKFPYTSVDLMKTVGGELSEMCPDVRVDVVNPEITVMIEIRDRCAYIHAGSVEGVGGMPKSSSGRGMLLLSGGIDSPVAGYMMAKRGVDVQALHFESYPYTSERARNKVIELAKKLCVYTDSMKFNIISLTEIQEAIRDNCDEEYFTLLLRRFMMELAERVARRNKCASLITGESLGQVASQTMYALGVTQQPIKLPVLRPLIAFDKEDIVRIARKIDTFETSVLPYEDCCTVFTPRHPKTRPELEKILEQESRLDRQGLMERAFESLDTMILERE
ncbi:MAG: tRNA 4-thiouridine(8) synthase ThiI [Ruminococcaceae bacterium]|nr:tRNA 4-thiouridine(8) synthase ThiI [Oscillospiraceae bacterium]